MNDEQLDEIEQRISATRRHVDTTLREIEERLEPEALVNQGLNYLRQSGANEFVSNLGSSVRQNPLPITFVALGMAWLMMTGRRSNGGPSRLAEAADSVTDRVFEGTRRAAETATGTAREWRDRASQSGQESADAARDMFDQARRGYERLREQQPLALGAVGLVIGAAIAMALPRTQAEDEWMGDASDRVADKAREVGREQVQRAEQVAASAAEAARREATHPAGTDESTLRETETNRSASSGNGPSHFAE
jgi:hypothetical protein